MTTTQINAMRAGREAQLAKQREADRAAVAAYREWVREEHGAYDAMLAARRAYGFASTPAHAAAKHWSAILAAMPATPSDSNPAWQS